MKTLDNSNYENQKIKLFKKIWKIANKLRGKVDSWDFKAYVLGFLFYRYISENITDYINKNEPESFNYENISDSNITEETRNDIINEKGFFIYPSQLFKNVLKQVKDNIENLNEIVTKIFSDIERSAINTIGESNIKGIFGGIDFNSNNLGSNVISRNNNILKIMNEIDLLELGKFENKTIDIFGDAYEFLMSMYASDAGKAGGEYFTPQEVSRLLTLIAIGNKKQINKIYDPACGSGSLLLQAEKILGNSNVIGGFYGQDSNPTTYNLCRMNMFLHNVNYDKFDIQCEDTLINPMHSLDNKYEIIVSNPPYSIEWEGINNPLLINDPRYAPAGKLAPVSKSDFAFIMHSLYLLDINGTASIVCFPGIFYRTGVENEIRKYLVENNFIEAIIALPGNLFFGTTINTNILVLSKNKKNNKTLFIDASKLFIKDTNQNKLSEDNIQQILKTYLDKKEIEYFSKIVGVDEIRNNDYDLSISNYIQNDNDLIENTIDIKELNFSIEQIVIKNEKLRKEIKTIIQNIENK